LCGLLHVRAHLPTLVETDLHAHRESGAHPPFLVVYPLLLLYLSLLFPDRCQLFWSRTLMPPLLRLTRIPFLDRLL
jgi:hypothetical protein